MRLEPERFPGRRHFSASPSAFLALNGGVELPVLHHLLHDFKKVMVFNDVENSAVTIT